MEAKSSETERRQYVGATIFLVHRNWQEIQNSGGWYLPERLKWLQKLDELIIGHRDGILASIAADTGLGEHCALISEYTVVRNLAKYYLRRAEGILGENRSNFLSLTWGNKKVTVKAEPLGVIGIITPWNSPFSIPFGKIVPALLTGNGVVWKSAPESPATTHLLAYLLEKSLEPFKDGGPFGVLPPDISCGEALVSHSLIAKIAFTGSEKGGEAVRRASAAARNTPPLLELGGSNAAIVLEDADIEEAARIIMWARFSTISCNNIKRVYAVRSVYWELVGYLCLSKFLCRHEAASIPEKEKGNYERFVQEWLEHLRQLGYDRERFLWEFGEHLQLVNTAIDKAYWGPPLAKILPIWRLNEGGGRELSVLYDEVFCPLLPVVLVEDEGEAVRLANESRFGLGASVFTRDKKRFEQIARCLECGTIMHNDAMTEFAMPQVPFGGWKNSGFGHVHGPEGLLEFTRRRTIVTERYSAPKLQLFPWTPRKMKFLRKFADLILKLS